MSEPHLVLPHRLVSEELEPAACLALPVLTCAQPHSQPTAQPLRKPHSQPHPHHPHSPRRTLTLVPDTLSLSLNPNLTLTLTLTLTLPAG